MSLVARKGRDGWTEQRVEACLIRRWRGNASIVQDALLVRVDLLIDAMRLSFGSFG